MTRICRWIGRLLAGSVLLHRTIAMSASCLKADVPIVQCTSPLTTHSGRIKLLGVDSRSYKILSVMPQRSMDRRVTFRLILAAMLLRVLVPAGLMPAGHEGSWHLEICPDGLPGRVVAALLGHDHVHHTENATAFQYCDLGAAFAGSFLVGDADELILTHGSTPEQTLGELSPATLTATYAFRPRGPPHLSTSV
jgi:hypothetical protein